MSIRILYMEDDQDAARLFQRRMGRIGYEVDIARNGEIGLQMALADNYDVLAIDHSMPVYDGLQVIRMLTEERDLRTLPPIIMVTGAGDEHTATEAIKMGASDYIVKDIEGSYLSVMPSVIEQALIQRQMEAEKRRAEEERERLIGELDAFAHTVAHDLKSPLTVLYGYVDFLKGRVENFDTADWYEHIRFIERSVLKMRNIIDELLLLSQVRSMEDLSMEMLDMALIVAEAQERLAPVMKERQAQIEFPADWPRVPGYAPWIEEVWVNYISNAVKYGGDPPVVQLGADEAAGGHVRFWVRDNGPGIPPEEQPRLFAPFIRLTQVRAQGHGLGLSIVHRIIERLGGRVGLQSTPGEGSTFWFTLPTLETLQAGGGFGGD
jgi:signal transduction histidine kinase